MPVKAAEFFWNTLIGPKQTFRLEVRIFHCICVILLLGAFISIPLNALLIDATLAWLMSIVFVVISGVFTLSRVLHKSKIAIVFSQVAYYCFLPINYYFNSGSLGPSLLIYLLALIFTILTVPWRQYWVWIPINVVSVLSIFFLEITGLVTLPDTYPSAESRLADIGYSYFTIAVISIFVLIYIRQAYHQERTQAQLKSEELAKSDQTKNKLLSIVAHDLKDPLISVQGFLELLSDDSLSLEDRRRLEKELQQRTNNAIQMLGNILTWSKTQMDGVQVNLQHINLADCLSKTLSITRAIGMDKGIHISSHIAPDIMIKADADMLQLVMRNLIVNAVKFSHPGSDIAIKAVVEASDCIISVKDQGVGIPKEKQAEIFGIAQGNTFGTNREKGSGLGLALCKSYIEQQGGKIWVHSQTQLGSTFYVSLKLGKPSANPAEHRLADITEP
ncbi:hypothetical protein BCY91_00060 [Pelobium manganitolerans]|uniref:histidine kinase n=1 Tax=Pelobium manganitolerans TaxID=1842495 RepID=A0A419SBL5_9SPHI|nr:HAMP domain-containing sensor histidine kinase [Pelobium manganitolerans]RKD20060.1 hypothetical protein BCY91_00060 [Pelobium manganitolerans]